MENKKFKRSNKKFLNSDNVMKNGILIGCHHGLTSKEINYMMKNFNIFSLSSKNFRPIRRFFV